MIRDAFADLNRVRQVAVIAGKFGFGELLEKVGFKHTAPPGDGDLRLRNPAARRFRLMLEELGPTFVKLGQIMSTRSDLLPADLVEELAALQDQAPPFPFEVAKAEIESGLGQPISRVFSQIQETPLAAASIAQVHCATTLDGNRVIVKVQRPTVAAQLKADLSALRSLARMLEAVVEEFAVYRPTILLDEFEQAIEDELNFLTEASNVHAFAEAFSGQPTLKIPKVYDALTARTVLTLEHIDAPKLSVASLDETTRKKLALIIVECAFQQVFEKGLFHADPHPGNLLVLEGPILGLIDYGLVGRITRAMQDTLVSLALAISFKDAHSVARILMRVSATDTHANSPAFRQDIANLLASRIEGSLSDHDAKYILRELLDLAVRHRLRLPKEYALLARSAVAAEGVIRMLYPKMPIAQTILPYTKRILAERFDLSLLPSELMKTALRLQSAAYEVPQQLSQILLDIESGQFAMNVRSDQISDLNASIRSLALVAFSGLCACGFIIGTFIAFSSKTWNVDGIPTLGLLGIASSIALIAVVAIRSSFGPFRKISLRKLLRSPTKRIL